MGQSARVPSARCRRLVPFPRNRNCLSSASDEGFVSYEFFIKSEGSAPFVLDPIVIIIAPFPIHPKKKRSKALERCYGISRVEEEETSNPEPFVGVRAGKTHIFLLFIAPTQEEENSLVIAKHYTEQKFFVSLAVVSVAKLKISRNDIKRWWGWNGKWVAELGRRRVNNMLQHPVCNEVSLRVVLDVRISHLNVHRFQLWSPIRNKQKFWDFFFRWLTFSLAMFFLISSCLKKLQTRRSVLLPVIIQLQTTNCANNFIVAHWLCIGFHEPVWITKHFRCFNLL